MPWQDWRLAAEAQAHNEPAPDDDGEPRRKNYFSPVRCYCTETSSYPCGTPIAWELFDKSESPTNILGFLEHTLADKSGFICIGKA